MKHQFTRASWIIVYFLITVCGHAQSSFWLSGSVKGENGDPLPYASISFNNAQYGTITNSDGEYRIKLPAGSYALRITYLGYRPITQDIQLETDQIRDFTLIIEDLTLEDVIITSDGRDPAYAIMKKAIDEKENNETPFPLYQYKAYTKSAFRFREGFDPDSLMLLGPFGRREPKNDSISEKAPAELQSELLYLSENISDVYVQPPKKIKERIIKSKVSGDSDQFSILGSLFNRFNPYENRTSMGDMSERGIVSPMSNNAFFFYEFKLLGTIINKEGKSFKIQAIPKREFDPVYQGILYIADSSYAVKEIDWLVTKQQQIQLIDTLSIRQTYQRIQGSWLPIQSRIGFAVDFKIFGLTIPIQGFTQSIISDYQIDPELESKFFDREIIAIDDSAVTQDSSYWELVRPIPLTVEEIEDYQFKDSLEVVQNSPEYLDSLTRANRSVKPLDLLISGYSYTNYRKNTSWEIESLLETLGFNPMEGFYVAPSVSHFWDFDKKGSFEIQGRVRYGFSSEDLSGQIRMRWVSSPARNTAWEFAGGIYPREFSDFSQIDGFINASYALLSHRSFIRLYRSSFGQLRFQSEVLNGLTFNAELLYDRRQQMVNQTEYSFFKEERTYVPNFSFPDHQAFIGTITLRYQPFNRYISIPGEKINLGSTWPTIEMKYRQTLGGSGETWSDFSSLTLTLEHELSMGLLGNSQLRVTGGRFFQSDQTYLQDLFHFKGNETIIRDGTFDEFWLMPYYIFSTTTQFLEGHWEHSFGGFVMNKIPLLRRLKLNEYLGFHILKPDGDSHYAEMNFGLEKRIFKVLPLRVDVNVRVSGSPVSDKWGWKLALP